MSPPPAERPGSRAAPALAAAALAFSPKCLLCLAAYAGLGGLLGGRPAAALCGAASAPGRAALSWPVVLLPLAVAIGVAAPVRARLRGWRRQRPARAGTRAQAADRTGADQYGGQGSRAAR